MQIGLYAIGFAVGPEGATAELAGVSLYRIASVVTFPFVHLAERLGWPGAGLVALPLNSAAWGAGAYAVLAAAGALLERRRRGG